MALFIIELYSIHIQFFFIIFFGQAFVSNMTNRPYGYFDHIIDIYYVGKTL